MTNNDIIKKILKLEHNIYEKVLDFCEFTMLIKVRTLAKSFNIRAHERLGFSL